MRCALRYFLPYAALALAADQPLHGRWSPEAEPVNPAAGYIEAAKGYTEAYTAKVAAEENRGTTLDSPSMYASELKHLIKVQAATVPKAAKLKEEAEAEAGRLQQEVDDYELVDPAAEDHVDQASALKTTVGAIGCECADQLYGSTTTTTDTSVALLAKTKLLKKANLRKRPHCHCK